MGQIGLKELAIFSRQLATMTTAGLPLVQSVSIIAEQSDDRTLKAILGEIAADLKGGANFSEAIKKHPGVFSPLYVNMCRAGEVGGNLDTILERLAAHLESSSIFRLRIRQEIIMPCIWALVALVAGGILVYGVIAPYAGIVPPTGKAATPLALGLLAACASYAGVLRVAGIALAVGVALVLLALGLKGRVGLVDSVLLHVPLVGPLWKKIIIARFARILATLQKCGVPILDAMEIVASIIGNVPVANALRRARSEIREGEGVAAPFKRMGVFPNMVIQMIAAGEETGKLDDMLLRIADFYDAEVDTAILPARWPMVCVVVGVAFLVHGIAMRIIAAPFLSAVLPK